MTAPLAELVDWAGSQFWIGFAVILRVGAMMALLPAFGEQAVPARVKIAVTLAATLVVAPALAPAIGPMPASQATLGRSDLSVRRVEPAWVEREPYFFVEVQSADGAYAHGFAVRVRDGCLDRAVGASSAPPPVDDDGAIDL